jgi:hypothetical protein
MCGFLRSPAVCDPGFPGLGSEQRTEPHGTESVQHQRTEQGPTLMVSALQSGVTTEMTDTQTAPILPPTNH